MPSFPDGVCHKGGAAAAITHREARRQADAQIAPLILELRGQGLSLRAIAAELTARGIKTRQGWHTWHARQVARILARAAAAEGLLVERTED
jgi:hypothetical protein